MRGIANIEPMTVETCVRLGRSAAHVFKDGTHRHRILIGKDTRVFCPIAVSRLGKWEILSALSVSAVEYLYTDVFVSGFDIRVSNLI